MVSIANPIALTTNLQANNQQRHRVSKPRREMRRGLRHSVCAMTTQDLMSAGNLPEIGCDVILKNGGLLLDTPPTTDEAGDDVVSSDDVTTGKHEESVLKFVKETQIARPMGQRTKFLFSFITLHVLIKQY